MSSTRIRPDKEDFKDDIRSYSYNANVTLFCLCDREGARVMSGTTGEEVKFIKGDYSMAMPMYQSNIVLLVGFGRDGKKQVFIYDCVQEKFIVTLQFKMRVRGARIRKDRLFVAVKNSIHIFDIKDFSLIKSIPTGPNKLGLLSCSYADDIQGQRECVLAFPATQKGQVSVYRGIEKDGTIKNKKTIQAHQGEIFYLILSFDGKYLATASEQGTLIRIWDIHGSDCAQPLQELRRGRMESRIHSCAFSPDNNFFVATSDNPTIHAFNIIKSGEQSKNPKTLLGFQKGETAIATYNSQREKMNVETELGSLVWFSPNSKGNNFIIQVLSQSQILTLQMNPNEKEMKASVSNIHH